MHTYSRHQTTPGHFSSPPFYSPFMLFIKSAVVFLEGAQGYLYGWETTFTFAGVVVAVAGCRPSTRSIAGTRNL